MIGRKLILTCSLATISLLLSACQGPLNRAGLVNDIRRVALVFDMNPWLSFDPAGDGNPEGIKFSVYLIDGRTARGAFGNGDIVVQMYVYEPDVEGSPQRVLAKEWRFTPETAPRGRVEKPVGWGYGMRLDWRPANMVNKDIEVGVLFERADGQTVRSQFKKLRVPSARQLQPVAPPPIRKSA